MKVMMILAALAFTTTAQAKTLECTKEKPKKQESCFLEKSHKLTIKFDGKNILLSSDEFKNAKGTYSRKIKKTGDSMYDAPEVAEQMDQSDLGKVFISEDKSEVTLSLRFTDDDGPQSFESCHYTCE